MTIGLDLAFVMPTLVPKMMLVQPGLIFFYSLNVLLREMLMLFVFRTTGLKLMLLYINGVITSYAASLATLAGRGFYYRFVIRNILCVLS